MSHKSKSNQVIFEGHSLLEVIVSTLLILIAFLLFSSLLGQLFSSRRIVPETSLLMKLSSFKSENGSLDTAKINGTHSGSNTVVSSRYIDSFYFWEVYISEKSTGKKLLQYYTTTSESDVITSLFQE